ncbi:MAG TPA: tetratricopeptide repeat protein [Gemmatimonadaceae bacterium]|nr:tetratricopeptide repeat protein [Gemmatimonadaceae bacterium]
MADSATGLERSLNPAAYSPVPSGSAARVDCPRGQPGQDDPQDNLAALIRRGTVKEDAGELAEAADCFRGALEIADRTLGTENPDLIILLNDLTRLYLKQSAYSSAEPLLLRLLDLKRNKGEDHPEVATVLASLAAVRRALGMHESAEQLWRRVLEIRERTLAPNHFATASALEHLGDACAARGKIREALAAFQRALTIREKTLGNGHPSLRIARERIADLELQASDDMWDASGVTETPQVAERHRLLLGAESAANAAVINPAPQIKLAPAGPTKAAPLGDVRPIREKKPTLMIPRTYVPPAIPADQSPAVVERAESVIMPAPDVGVQPTSEEEAPALALTTVDYRDALERVREELESSENEPTITTRTGEWLSSVAALIGKREVLAGITLVAMALLGVAVATDRHALGENAPVEKSPVKVTAPNPTVATAAAASTPVAPANSASSSSESTSKTAKPRGAEDRPSPKKVADKKTEQPARVSIPALSTAVLSRLDSAAAKAAAVGSVATEPFNLQPAPVSVSRRRATFDDDQTNTAQRARLIGELPTPRVPQQVMDVEGEVRVRFNVDSLGQPVIETFSVISSPNPLLTAAVRKVIPGMRFEPARTAGPDSKPIADVVQIGFQFARSK